MTTIIHTTFRLILILAAACLSTSCDQKELNKNAKKLGDSASQMAEAFKNGMSQSDGNSVSTSEVGPQDISIKASTWLKKVSQATIDDAFPVKIGKAPVTGVKIDDVTKQGAGYSVTATVSYTNIARDSNYLKLNLSYDLAGNYTGYTVGYCNDQWANPSKVIEALEVK